MSTGANLPFRRIADLYRARIIAGEYGEGDRLPPITDIAAEQHVAPATVTSAMRQLQSEKLVTITRRGTVVSAPRGLHTPDDRLKISRGAAAPGEVETVREAGVIPFGDEYAYVAGHLNDDAAGHVVRREKVISQLGKPIGLAVTWYPVRYIPTVPELAVPAPIAGGETSLIAERTGKRVIQGEDFWEGRGARDDREADAVGVAIGDPILAGAWLWRDPDGDVIEYGETVLISKRAIRYEYELTHP